MGSELINSTISLLIFSEHPQTNFAQIFCIFSSLWIIVVCTVPTMTLKLCTYCLYRHTMVLIHEILYLANQLWCTDFLTPATPLIIPHRLLAFLESLMSLKNWCSIHARWSKSSLKLPYISVAFFPSLKHNFIAYQSSKVSSRLDCIFEIYQLWQSGFIRVYSNCCCSCSFEPEIIKIGQLSHKMYSNNILNFQESTTILNACTKNVWKLIKGTSYLCEVF